MVVKDVLELVKERVKEIDSNAQLRLLEIFNNRISRVYSPDEQMEFVATYPNSEIRAEEIPQEETQKEHGDRIVQVQHFCREHMSIRLFGAPFFILVKANDTLLDVKKRIQNKLQIKDEEFKTYKFATLLNMQKHDYIEENENVIESLKKVEAYRLEAALGMEHKDPQPRPHVTRWYDKPIVIKG